MVSRCRPWRHANKGERGKNKGITSLEKRIARWVSASDQLNQKKSSKSQEGAQQVPRCDSAGKEPRGPAATVTGFFPFCGLQTLNKGKQVNQQNKSLFSLAVKLLPNFRAWVWGRASGSSPWKPCRLHCQLLSWVTHCRSHLMSPWFVETTWWPCVLALCLVVLWPQTSFSTCPCLPSLPMPPAGLLFPLWLYRALEGSFPLQWSVRETGSIQHRTHHCISFPVFNAI